MRAVSVRSAGAQFLRQFLGPPGLACVELGQEAQQLHKLRTLRAADLHDVVGHDHGVLAVGDDGGQVLDPELWPEGPQEEDRRRLLGVLLAKTELEITAATRLGHDQDEGEVLLGWIEAAGPDSALSTNVLVNRLQRTGVQLMGLEEAETPPGRLAACMAVVTAADTFSFPC